MPIEVLINGTDDGSGSYLTWAPSRCQIANTGAAGDLPVRLQTRAGSKGRLAFYETPSSDSRTFLNLTLPASGSPVEFWMGGEFDHPSTEDGDTSLGIRTGGSEIASVPLMIRVRKNANKMSVGERDRFVQAFARFNDQGRGGFTAFRDMHVRESSPEAHGWPGFLPWHRSYLLDLERELQALDPSVTLPYWRFDQPAPNLFHLDFIGVSVRGRVRFGRNNPLQFWATDGTPGILRTPRFIVANQAPSLRSETETLDLGSDGLYQSFRVMERNPHGSAHTSFGGSISSISTAAKDPLFFLLHCNVDRLWAKWQWTYRRFDPADQNAFEDGPARVGHNLGDTMWPWNGITTPPRPSSAPGGGLAASPIVTAPGSSPLVRDMLDMQGRSDPARQLGFDYVDVPFD